jgi:hypothetical protein
MEAKRAFIGQRYSADIRQASKIKYGQNCVFLRQLFLQDCLFFAVFYICGKLKKHAKNI